MMPCRNPALASGRGDAVGGGAADQVDAAQTGFEPMNHRVFSYGTLQLPGVQQALFGGPVAMRDDVLTGFQTVTITITDPDVLNASGIETHLALIASADPSAAIPGRTLELDDAQLDAVDAYEGDNYRRTEVTLASGTRAWVYLKA